MRALLVYNKFSGKSKIAKKIEYICSELKTKYEIVECFKSTHPRSITEHILTKDGVYDLLIVVGGDGSIHEVINGVMNMTKKPILAYIPAGTCNDAAATLGISKNFKKAVKTILTEKPEYIDVSKINDEYFIYGLAAGCLTEVSYKADHKVKKNVGKFAYYLQSIKSLNKTNSIEFTLESKDVVFSGKFSLFLSLNTRFLAGFRIHRKKKICLNDGKLRITLIKKTNKLVNVFDFGMFLIFGESYKHNIVNFDASEFVIKSNQPIAYNTDGEKFASTTELNVKVLPNDIQVIVPDRIRRKFFYNN